MKSTKKEMLPQPVSNIQRMKVLERSGQSNPELIEKFYKQIINSFGYAAPAKV